MGNVETLLTALLTKFGAGINKILFVAEIHAVLDSHVRRVGIAGRGEGSCRDIVPNS